MLICLPPIPIHPAAFASRSTSTIVSTGSGPSGSAVDGAGRPSRPPVARSRARSLASSATGRVLIGSPRWNTCRVRGSTHTVTIWPDRAVPSQI